MKGQEIWLYRVHYLGRSRNLDGEREIETSSPTKFCKLAHCPFNVRSTIKIAMKAVWSRLWISISESVSQLSDPSGLAGPIWCGLAGCELYRLHGMYGMGYVMYGVCGLAFADLRLVWSIQILNLYSLNYFSTFSIVGGHTCVRGSIKWKPADSWTVARYSFLFLGLLL